MFLDFKLDPGASYTQPVPKGWSAFIYTLAGEGEFGTKNLLLRTNFYNYLVHGFPVCLRSWGWFPFQRGAPHSCPLGWYWREIPQYGVQFCSFVYMYNTIMYISKLWFDREIWTSRENPSSTSFWSEVNLSKKPSYSTVSDCWLFFPLFCAAMKDVRLCVTPKISVPFAFLACKIPVTSDVLGPFVMNTKEEIAQTFKDYRLGQNGFESAPNWHSSVYE